jgi:hypothetical protein
MSGSSASAIALAVATLRRAVPVMNAITLARKFARSVLGVPASWKSWSRFSSSTSATSGLPRRSTWLKMRNSLKRTVSRRTTVSVRVTRTVSTRVTALTTVSSPQAPSTPATSTAAGSAASRE